MFKMKIGRHEYQITESDRFLDNGYCVQLLTQSKLKSDWGRRPNPVMSKKTEKDFKKLVLIEYAHGWGGGCKLYGIKLTPTGE